MKLPPRLSTLGALLALTLLFAGCTQPATAPTPTTSAAPAAQATATTKPTVAPTTAAGPAAGTLGDEFSYEQTVTTTGQEPLTAKVSVKNGKTRVELTEQGEPVVIISDPQTQTAQLVLVNRKQAMQVPYDVARAGTESDPTVLVRDLQPNQMVGTETVDGQATDVYAVNDPQTVPYKVWVAKDNGLPIKVESQDSEGSTTTLTFKNYQRGNLPDSLFQLPSDVTVVPVGTATAPSATPTTP